MKKTFYQAAVFSGLICAAQAAVVVYDEDVSGDLGTGSGPNQHVGTSGITANGVNAFGTVVDTYTINGRIQDAVDDGDSFNFTVEDGAVFDFSLSGAAIQFAWVDSSWDTRATLLGGNNVNVSDLAGGEYSVHFFANSTSTWTATIDVKSPAGLVPEPSSSIMAAVGFGALALRRKRKA